MTRTTTSGSQWSVRTFLIWLVLACLLPGVIGATLLFVYEYREGRAQQEEDTIQTARALVQAVDNHLLRAQAVAQALSTSDSLASEEFTRFHQRAREAIALSGLGTNAVLRDDSGRQILNTAVDIGKPLTAPAAPEQVRRVFATAKPTVSDLFIGPVLKLPLMSVDVPVTVNGKVVYALGVGIVPEHFNTILKAQNLPSGWIAAVFDSTGTIVGRTHSPAQFVGRKANARLLDSMMKSPEGSIHAKTQEGFSVVSFYSRSPVTNWKVAIGIPREDVLAGLVRTLSMLAAGVAALFGAGLLLARVMSRRIAQSVHALTAPAIALGNGDSVVVPRVHIKEAAEVAAALGRASDLLKERAAALHAREKELAEAHRLAKFGTWSWDLATGDITTSESLREIYGCQVPSFPEMRGTLLPVESWDRIDDASIEAIRTGKGYDLEVWVNHGSGDIIWINAKCEVVRNEKNEITGLRGMVQDITERKRADALLRQSEQELWKFKFFSDHGNDGHLLLDETGCIRYANKLACERLGYCEAELLQKNISDIDFLYTEERFQEIFTKSKQVRVPPFEGMHRRSDGSTFPVEITATVLELKGEWLMFTTSRDITERKHIEQRVRDAALHDVLTGLPNRALVMDYCERLLAAAQRGHGRGALLFIDLDRFKPINDIYGHKTGDRVLQEVGKRLITCTRQEDLVGRLGGDEFVIVLPHLDTCRHRAAVVAQHVVDSIRTPFRVDAIDLTISPSIGISFFPEHASDVSTLIHTADLAMYQAKQSGRANYQFYTHELDQRADQLLLLELRLKNALKHGGLQLHYQPVIDIKSGKLIGAEALVRLADNGGDAVGPDRFIPVAESAGLIGELGEWVAAEACRQHGAWLSLGMQLTMAINVSPLQFRQPAFAERLNSIILETGMNPAQLEIEVTESAVMDSIDDAVTILNRIKSFGVKVALDDFGTGYSSLSSLTSLPLDKLKVDQSFVRRIERDQASRAVTDAIIALGRSLRLDVHGEGIESENVLRYLEQQGCNQAQGYWFSQPLPPFEFAELYWEHWETNSRAGSWDDVRRIWSPKA